MSNLRQHLLALFSLASLSVISCYSPDLTTQIYKCDRGKCPEGFYCTDGFYCTQDAPHCPMGGIVVSDTVNVCVGAPNINDPTTICTSGASKCDATTMTPLCAGIDKDSCTYCCKK